MLRKSKSIEVMGSVTVVIEGLVAALLVILAGWGVVSLAVSVFHLVMAGPVFSLGRYIAVIDVALVIFVIVELFRIAVAYLRNEDVIPIVLEAGVVAIARKLVTFDTHTEASIVLLKAGGLAALLLAVGITWYLLAKRNPALIRADDSADYQ